jgi:hypothetical protein
MSEHQVPWTWGLRSAGGRRGDLAAERPELVRVLWPLGDVGSSVGSVGEEMFVGVRDWGLPIEEVSA